MKVLVIGDGKSLLTRRLYSDKGLTSPMEVIDKFGVAINERIETVLKDVGFDEEKPVVHNLFVLDNKEAKETRRKKFSDKFSHYGVAEKKETPAKELTEEEVLFEERKKAFYEEINKLIEASKDETTTSANGLVNIESSNTLEAYDLIARWVGSGQYDKVIIFSMETAYYDFVSPDVVVARYYPYEADYESPVKETDTEKTKRNYHIDPYMTVEKLIEKFSVGDVSISYQNGVNTHRLIRAVLGSKEPWFKGVKGLGEKTLLKLLDGVTFASYDEATSLFAEKIAEKKGKDAAEEFKDYVSLLTPLV